MVLLRISFFLFLFLLTLLTFSFHYKVPLSDPVIIDIKEGSSVSSTSKLLLDKNFIIDDFLFNLYSKIISADKSIKAGEYYLDSSNSIHTYLKLFSSGQIHYRKLTLLPGMTLNDIYLLRLEEGLIDDLGKRPEISLKELGINYKEGMFYPDTYFFQRGDKYSSILLAAQEKWKSESEILWSDRNEILPYKNLTEAITLASIVEKEGLEKNKIAGVFINRLRIGMKLQSDPTVIYALGKDFDGDIKRKDLRIDNPYNTYRYKGLPPGPISIVSIESLEAALNPEKTDFLYFVSMKNGFHKFSKNLTEHNEAVLKYQINER
ncbi:endolytic transglycosylase MltG [Gammaproteobacteria bacterium]|nr:endolytic transglycosylase MltG [Gammaproteobacteria bacterium]